MNKFWNIVGIITISAIALAMLIPALSVAISTLRAKFKGFSQALACVFAIGVILYGSTKGFVSGRITYPRTNPDVHYLVDAGSFVTNDYIHVAFATHLLLPRSAQIKGFYRERTSTNELDWVEFVDTTIELFPMPSDIPFPAATNYNFIFYATWPPSPTAHTNGTATIMWTKKDSNTLIPYRTGIYLDGERIAPSHSITNGPYSGSINLLQNLMED